MGGERGSEKEKVEKTREGQGHIERKRKELGKIEEERERERKKDIL